MRAGAHGRVCKGGGQESGQLSDGEGGVRSWALSAAESVQQQRHALLDASSDAASDACLDSVQDADEEEEEEESEAEGGEEESSDVAKDAADRCFLANADDMQEVEVSSCTPSSQQDRAQPATLPGATGQHEKRAMEEDPEGRDAERDGHAVCDLNHLDPISEFKRAVSARGHGSVEQHWLPPHGPPSPRTRTLQSDGGQEARQESSSEVAEFRQAMGPCDAVGRCCHTPPFMPHCPCPAAALFLRLLLLLLCRGRAANRDSERALGFRPCLSRG